VDLPQDLQEYAEQISQVLHKLAGKLNIKNAKKKERVELNKQVYLDEEFKHLWDQIKYQTTYRVNYDVEQLIQECAEQIEENLVVGSPKFINKTALLEIDRGGVQAQIQKESSAVYASDAFALPDILTYLQNQTNLTRETLVKILVKSNKLDVFKKNPQKYIEQVADIIKRSMRHFIVDGIKYQRLGDEYYYAQELFENNELFGYLHDNMVESQKSVYSHVVYDSELERDFALAFERSDDIKVYAKLPGWFVIDTPLGSYNPDWAVFVEIDGQNRLYFVVETKGSMTKYDLRLKEDAKIKCGQEHFKALDTDVQFTKADNFQTFANKYAEYDNVHARNT
jgi:type III restriction enzyme